jgi:hypothetical protein
MSCKLFCKYYTIKIELFLPLDNKFPNQYLPDDTNKTNEILMEPVHSNYFMMHKTKFTIEDIEKLDFNF